jgi:serine phosphatase RsbU (regulator of sigma subunit)
MQCSEVWGGNDPVERGVVMQGLDAWVLSRPAGGDDAGGDMHYLSSCATGRITRLLIADVSGHGREVADLSLRLRSLMRRFVNYVDQSRLMAGVNTEFAKLSDSGRFATAIIATYWGPTGDLDITNAGHPPPLVYRAATKSWSYLSAGTLNAGATSASSAARDRRKLAAAHTTDPSPGSRAAPADSSGPSDLPLGVLDQTSYSRASLTLDRGDLLLLYTDALIETLLPDGTLLGQQGLLATVRTLNPADPAQLAKSLAAEVDRLHQGPPDDDATILLVRPNSLRPRGSLKTGMTAGLRLAREFLASLTGKGPFAWPELKLRNFLGAFFDSANTK